MPLGAPGISSGQVRVMGIKNGRQEIAGSSLSQGVSKIGKSVFDPTPSDLKKST